MDLVIDYAAVDDNATPDLDAARLAGLTAGIIRASYSKWQDLTCRRDADRFRKAGMKFGGYGFPDLDAGAPSMAAQGKAAVDGAGLIAGVDMPMWIDIEFARGILATHQGDSLVDARTHLAGAIADYRKAVEDAQGVGAGLYGSARVLDTDDTDTLNGDANAALSGMPGWLARYVLASRLPAETTQDFLSRLPAPPVPKCVGGADDWWFRQYQGDAIRFPGFTSTVDCDVFHALTLGAHGTRVLWVQSRLPGVTRDGGFGPETLAALILFQAKCKLVPTGCVDLSTFIALAWQAPIA